MMDKEPFEFTYYLITFDIFYPLCNLHLCNQPLSPPPFWLNITQQRPKPPSISLVSLNMTFFFLSFSGKTGSKI